ncbi:MAG: DUF2059 domain-containing protein [Ferrovibrio sp.]
MRVVTLLLVATLLGFSANEAKAQTTLNPAALTEARKIVEVLGAIKTFEQSFNGSVSDILARMNPGKEAEARKVAEDILLPELKSLLPVIAEEYAKLYAQVFSADELRAMGEFYATPVGKRIAEKSPVYAQQSMALSQGVAMGQLQAILMKNAEKVRARGLKI